MGLELRKQQKNITIALMEFVDRLPFANFARVEHMYENITIDIIALCLNNMQSETDEKIDNRLKKEYISRIIKIINKYILEPQVEN